MTPHDLRKALFRVIAVLEAERSALAGLDLHGILTCAQDKSEACRRLDDCAATAFDEECRALLASANRLNDVNRKMRNLIADNVQARLNALTGTAGIYSVG